MIAIADLCALRKMLFSLSLLFSEYQVKELGHGVRLHKGNACSEKQSPDSACSMDYSNSRLSSPDQPGEGKTHLNLNMHTDRTCH